MSSKQQEEQPIEPTTELTLSRRKLPKYKKNPFVDDQLITQLSGMKNVFYTQTTRNAIVDMETGETTPAQLQIVKKVQTDKENFVKVFTTHLKAFFELSAVAFKLLQYVLDTVQNEAIHEDKIYLSLNLAQEFYQNQGSQISKASYYRGMKELVEKLFIAEAIDTNIYFINPKLFFNGDRVEFLTKFYVSDEKPKDEKTKIEQSKIKRIK